jgi:hypothetical protein
MSKLIKKYKENYRNFSRIFKGLFEHAEVQLAKCNTHTQEREVHIAKWKMKQKSVGLKSWSGLVLDYMGMEH